jgi:hypothetical protein
MASKAVDETKTGTVTKMTPVQRFVEVLALEAEDSTGDATEFVESILTAMIEAQTMEDVIAAQNQGATNGKSLVNVELEISWFRIVKSADRFKTPLKHYALVDKVIRLDTLESCPFSTGAPNLIIPLWKARNLGVLPLRCVIRSRETDNGELLTLELLPKRPLEDGPGF